MTWADVPSGATSVSRTTAVATGAETDEVEDDLRDAEDLERRLERLARCRSGRAPRRVGGRGRGRWAVRRRPTTGRRASRRSGGGRSGRRRPALVAPRSADRPPTSGSDPPREPPLRVVSVAGCGYAVAARQRPGQHRRERLRLGVLALEPDDRRLVSAPFGIPFSQRSKKRTSSCSSSRFGPGVADDGQIVDPVADDRPRRGGAGSLHPERRVDVRVHPAADVEDRRLDRVVVGRQRTGPPVRPVVLLAEPFDEPRRRRLEPGEPFVAPRLAPERRIGRHRVHRRPG